MIKIYSLIAGAVLIAGFIYGTIQYNKGYQKAQDEHNQAIINVMQKHNEEKNKIQNKIKRMQNAIDSNQNWSNASLPSDIIQLLSES